MSISVHGASKNKTTSTHGKVLLNELSIPNANINDVLMFISKDPNAALLKNKEGNNSFHVLMDSNHKLEFVIPVLHAMIERTPKGIRSKNKDNSLPLHCALSKRVILEEAILLVIDSYPDAAKLINNDGYIPLFYAVMRNNPSIPIVQRLLSIYPEGCMIRNHSQSLPLHFAVNRAHPNYQLIQLLLSYSIESASIRNNNGLLPIHCICSMSDNSIILQMIHNAYLDALQCKDTLGRTVLHLAVTTVGKDHAKAVQKEEKELLTRQQEDNNEKTDNINNNNNEEDSQSDSDETEEYILSNIIERGKKRDVIRYIIHYWPSSLITPNNFFHIPVETVLEKTKPITTKTKLVKVFGLYDDPPTARILLYAHFNYSLQCILPPMKIQFYKALKDLNWIARKDAIYISFVGEKKDMIINKKDKEEKNNKIFYKNGKYKQQNKKNKIKVDKEIFIPDYNILARLRKCGLVECMKQCIMFL